MSAIFYDNKVQNGTVKSIFAHLDSLINAIDAVQSAGHGDDLIVTTPTPRHDIEHIIYQGRPSPVRWFTLTGAIFGGFMGFALCAFTHLNWPMIIPAGKPIVSIPAFMVIGFESTVLWGCLFTLAGMVLMCRLPANKLQVEVQDPRLSDDKFGLVVNNLPRNKAGEINDILQQHGALEVVNGYEQQKPEKAIVPLADLGVEPDETDTKMLAKLAVVVSIIVLFTLAGVKMYFDHHLAIELNEKNYNYTHRAVAPSYRTVK